MQALSDQNGEDRTDLVSTGPLQGSPPGLFLGRQATERRCAFERRTGALEELLRNNGLRSSGLQSRRLPSSQVAWCAQPRRVAAATMRALKRLERRFGVEEAIATFGRACMASSGPHGLW